MVQKVNQLLNDKAWARWTALVLIASMMFFGYMFVDVMSPIQALIEKQKGWGPDTFGTYAASEGYDSVSQGLQYTAFDSFSEAVFPRCQNAPPGKR